MNTHKAKKSTKYSLRKKDVNMFKGSITALITPFQSGEIDWAAFEKFVEWQIEEGIHGVVPCGTTGESPTLSHDEHMAVVKRCVEIVNGRVPVIAGAGANSTHEAIELSKHAKKVGADAVLSVAPYYNKPTQAGIYAHFKAIHDAADMPVVLYDVPGRTVVDIAPETVIDLAKLPNIVGIKDATNDLYRPLQERAEIGKDFSYLSGEDGTCSAYLAQGGHGVISVVSNVAPALSSQMLDAWHNEDMQTFAKNRDLLAPLAKALFCESSPAPVKYAVSTLGLCSDEVRLPLLTATPEARTQVDVALAHAGITGGNLKKAVAAE